MYKSGVIILNFYPFLYVKKQNSGPADVTSWYEKIFKFRLDALTLKGLYVCEVNKYITIYV